MNIIFAGNYYKNMFRGTIVIWTSVLLL